MLFPNNAKPARACHYVPGTKTLKFGFARQLVDKSLNTVKSTLWASRLSNENLALLANNKDTASCSLGCLLETNGANESLLGVTQQRVRELLLLLESCVGLGRVGAETINSQTILGERLICVAEEADLLCACG